MRKAFVGFQTVVEGRQFAVKAAIEDIEHYRIRLQWKNACSYNLAASWVSKALGKSALEWTLVLAHGVASTKAKQPYESSPSAASQPPARQPRVASPVLAAPVSAVAKPGWGSVVPTKAVAQLACSNSSSSSWAPVQLGRAVVDPTKAWLPLKALEMKRGSSRSAAACEMAIYEAGAFLGEGSFGTVNRAVVKTTGQQVVIKRLRFPEFGEFLHEVCLLSRLTHPNVVSIVDVATEPVLTLVLEDCGWDLSLLVENRAPVLAGWRGLIRQLLQAVEYIHEGLIIHSDIKPANILVDGRGRVRLGDFGAAVVSLPGFRSERPRGSAGKRFGHFHGHTGVQ